MTTWYNKGLRFQCTQCAKCCTGTPGYVWISQEEIKQMAKFLNISIKKFIQTYTRQIQGKLSLKESGIQYDCIFLKDGKCHVYAARPKQCQTFPFWSKNLKSKKTWEETARRCEGINHESAPLIPLSVIQQNLKKEDA